MTHPLSAARIIGVALFLFSSVLLGVGIHHIIATGTCSSTGYSANFGPVRHCPAGTGAWFAFVFGGIIGALAGGMMAGGIAPIFGGIFGGIGIGALTLGFGGHVAGSTKTFAIAFGAPFTIVGLLAAGFALTAGIASLREAASAGRSTGSATPASKTRHPAGAPRPVATNAITPMPSPAFAVSGPMAMGMSAAPLGASTASSLAELAELHRQGALSDAEFAAAKAKVLGGTGV